MALWWKIGLSGFSIIRLAICNSGRDQTQTTMKIFFPFGVGDDERVPRVSASALVR